MLLRSDALADCCIVFLFVDEIDDVLKLSFLVSRCVLVIDVSFVSSLHSLIDRFASSLKTFDE